MRRLLGWIGGAVGGVAAYRWLRRPLPGGDAAPEPDARADELRAKLAESRTPEPTAEPVSDEPRPEPVAEEEPAPGPEAQPEPESPDERRRRVHEEGRDALDEMKSDGAA
jgi:hypothetical protein